MKAEYGEGGKLVITQTTATEAGAAKYFVEKALIAVGSVDSMLAALATLDKDAVADEHQNPMSMLVMLLGKLKGEGAVWRGSSMNFNVNRSFVAANGKVVR